MSAADEGSILSGMIWMAIVSILLFWLPAFGGLIAGVVGGMKAGGVVNGLLAALLPAVLLGVALFFAATVLSGVPVLGLVAGMGGFMLAMLQVGPLLVGAIIGGALA
ncbi:MAG: hypothetical protein ACU85V_13300 [Gammaproteobacteria bacterium]